jgi:hypothetical protein
VIAILTTIGGRFPWPSRAPETSCDRSGILPGRVLSSCKFAAKNSENSKDRADERSTARGFSPLAAVSDAIKGKRLARSLQRISTGLVRRHCEERLARRSNPGRTNPRRPEIASPRVEPAGRNDKRRAAALSDRNLDQSRVISSRSRFRGRSRSRRGRGRWGCPSRRHRRIRGSARRRGGFRGRFLWF